MLLVLIVKTLVLLVALLYLAYLWESQLNHRPGRVIYYSSNLVEQGRLVEGLIAKYLAKGGVPAKEYVLVEPGAGLARAALFLEKRFPWKEVVAVELAPIILTLGRFRAWCLRSKVLFVKANVFEYQPPLPSVSYCYLTDELLTGMYQKRRFAGQLVICLTFQIKGAEPTEVVPLKSWQKRLSVYDFR